VNPIGAAAMHVIGSLIVVFNSFRLVRSGEELEPFVAIAERPSEGAPAPAPALKPKMA